MRTRTTVHSLTSMVLEFKRRHGDNEIALAAMTPEAGHHFIAALLDQEPNRLDESFRQLLFQRTQGHPLFTVELLREMRVQRNLIRDESGKWIEGPGTNWEMLPSRVEAVIGRRLGRLPLPLQEALKVASAEGETFTAEVVACVQGVDAREMVRQLGSIVDRQHGLVRSEGTERLGRQVLSRYRFRHILFQKYLYQTLDAAERIYLHQAVGQALEEAYGEQAEDVAVQLAHHFQMAGLTAKAVDYLYRAGLRAAWRAAHREAIVHFTQGIDLLQRAPRLAESARQELRIQIALGISLAAMKGWSAPRSRTGIRSGQAVIRGDRGQFPAGLNLVGPVCLQCGIGEIAFGPCAWRTVPSSRARAERFISPRRRLFRSRHALISSWRIESPR